MDAPIRDTETSNLTSADFAEPPTTFLMSTSADVADESERIQNVRKRLMTMDLADLKTEVVDIKEEQPDVELPSGGKEEIVAWAIEWLKAKPEREEKEKLVKEEEKRAEEERAAHAREEARLLIVEYKDTPGQLHAFLRDNPLAVLSFKLIVTNPAHADWLGEAVKATPELAELADADGRRAFSFAHLTCKQAPETF